ncbi:MAG: signal peptidase II [Dehalococcoidales bacterium]|nr:signal peptidase II [Dehalococcoidales bacterium]
MPRVNRLQDRRWRTAIFFLVAALVVVGDRCSKLWIRSHLAVGQSLPETGFFRLDHVRNTGAAFGIFQSYPLALTVVSFIGVVIILIYALVICRRLPFLDNMVSQASLGVVLGGTVGNLIDRLRLGYVTDFLGVGTFPRFNVADAAITVGTAVFAGFLIYLIVNHRREIERGKIASSRD